MFGWSQYRRNWLSTTTNAVSNFRGCLQRRRGMDAYRDNLINDSRPAMAFRIIITVRLYGYLGWPVWRNLGYRGETYYFHVNTHKRVGRLPGWNLFPKAAKCSQNFKTTKFSGKARWTFQQHLKCVYLRANRFPRTWKTNFDLQFSFLFFQLLKNEMQHLIS